MKENSLMYNTATASRICWIGLHDIDSEGTFVWADGSNSMYRQWSSGEPNDAGLGEDCVHTSGQPEWNDQSCTLSWSCYYCITESEFSKIHYKIVIIMVLIKISIYSSITKLTNYIKTWEGLLGYSALIIHVCI